MDKFIVYIDDAEHAMNQLRAAASSGDPQTHWVVVACPPKLSRHAGKWISQSARVSWRNRWASALFSEVKPALTALDGTVQTCVAEANSSRSRNNCVRRTGKHLCSTCAGPSLGRSLRRSCRGKPAQKSHAGSCPVPLQAWAQCWCLRWNNTGQCYADAMKLIVKWLLYAAALLAVAHFYSGVQVQSFSAALIAAAVVGLLNVVLRPILVILTLPVTVLTLGLFLFVINALTFWSAASLLDGFAVQGFAGALIGSLIYSCLGMVIDSALERLFA